MSSKCELRFLNYVFKHLGWNLVLLVFFLTCLCLILCLNFAQLQLFVITVVWLSFRSVVCKLFPQRAKFYSNFFSLAIVENLDYNFHCIIMRYISINYFLLWLYTYVQSFHRLNFCIFSRNVCKSFFRKDISWMVLRGLNGPYLTHGPVFVDHCFNQSLC